MHQTHNTPAPAPTAGQAFGPAAAAPADPFARLVAVAFGRVDMTVTVSGRAQTQGDLLVLPWPATDAPAARVAALHAVTDLPARGVDLLRDGRHVLVPLGPRVAWGGQRSASGVTLGTLAVGADSVAVLSHPVHGDLRIGRGVYVIRRQRFITAPTPQPLPQPVVRDDAYWAMVMD
jgi:hypothetical protein